jgi:hypothetical protein
MTARTAFFFSAGFVRHLVLEEFPASASKVRQPLCGRKVFSRRSRTLIKTTHSSEINRPGRDYSGHSTVTAQARD